jgi:hypothetical protein
MLLTLKYTVTWLHPVIHLIFFIFRTVYRIFRSEGIVSNLNLIQKITEFFVFGYEAMLNKMKHCFPVDINFYQSKGSVTLVYLLSFRDYTSSVCKSSFLALCNFASIRKCLTISTATTVANALVSCRFEYCNSIFTGISTADVTRLQVFKIA